MARTIVLTEMALRSLQQSPLSKAEGAILWHLVDSLPVTGDAVSKSQFEHSLSVGPAQANRVMKRLCELGFLMRGQKIGVSYHYKLNPSFIKVIG